MGRLRSVAIGCFREAQLQGPPFGDEPGKAAGMSRPIAVGQPIHLDALKQPQRRVDKALADRAPTGLGLEKLKSWRHQGR